MKPALSEREGFAAFVLRMRSLGMTDQRLMTAFEATSRMAFVSGNLGTLAYGDRMLPIECGEFMEGLDLQARLIKALDLEPAHRVLEIGTGTGFTAAIMARLAGPSVAAISSSKRSDFSRIRMGWVSGSPRRALNSMV